MGELQQTNDDLHNVLTGIGEAIVIIGLDLRIRRFTQSAEKLLNLVPGDVGRSVSQLNAFIVGHRIEELGAQVIERMTPFEERVRCADQRWYDLRISPYRTLDQAIKGALIVLEGNDEQPARSSAGADPAPANPGPSRPKAALRAKGKR